MFTSIGLKLIIEEGNAMTKVKRTLSFLLVLIILICTFAVEASANNYASYMNYFDADSGNGYYSNTGAVSTSSTTVTPSKIKLFVWINGVQKRYVTAYIEKDRANGAMCAFQDKSGTYYPNESKQITMNRSSSDPSGTQYKTFAVVYNSTSSYSGVADSYSYWATIN